jgi:hypothetical protein
MAPPEPFARSTPVAIFGSALGTTQALMPTPLVGVVIMVSAACAQPFESDALRIWFEDAGEGGEVPAGQPLRGRDFCLFGRVSTREPTCATLAARCCRHANTVAERPLTGINASDLLIAADTHTARSFLRKIGAQEGIDGNVRAGVVAFLRQLYAIVAT